MAINFHGVLTKELTIQGKPVNKEVFKNENRSDKFMVYGMNYMEDYMRSSENATIFEGVTFSHLPDGSVVTIDEPIFQVSIPTEKKNKKEIKEIREAFNRLWYPIAVATLSRTCRDIIERTFTRIPENKHGYIDYMMQDFGFRGCSSVEQSIIGGSAHLLNFKGSDTMSASLYTELLNKKPQPTDKIPQPTDKIPQPTDKIPQPTGVSLPASEHSVMTSYEFEEDAMLNIMIKFGKGLFAMVMDSYDYVNSLTKVFPSALLKYLLLLKIQCGTFKCSSVDKTENAINLSNLSLQKAKETLNTSEFVSTLFREDANKEDIMKALITEVLPPNFKVVFRPDSGDPTTAVIQALQTGEAIFGVKEETNGLKELKYCGVIQGDGISVFTISDILNKVVEKGYSPMSVAFGMGGGLLQKVDVSSIGFELKDGTKSTTNFISQQPQYSEGYWDQLYKSASENWKSKQGGSRRRRHRKHIEPPKINEKRHRRKKRGGFLPDIMNTKKAWAWQSWTDSYKLSHTLMYSPSAKKMVAYGEPRGIKVSNNLKKIVVCGVKYIVDNYINKASTPEGFATIKEFFSHHYNGGQFPYNEELFKTFQSDKPPIEIKALAEGTVVLPHTPVYQITATGDNTPFVTFFETILTMVWYPMTVASLCMAAKEMLGTKKYKIYLDFGVCTSKEQAEIAKMAVDLVFGKETNYLDAKPNDCIDYHIDTFESEILNKSDGLNVYFGNNIFQLVNRDSVNFATKLSFVEEEDGSSRFIMKAPLGQADKRSLPGQLYVKAGISGKAPSVYSLTKDGQVIDISGETLISQSQSQNLLVNVYSLENTISLENNIAENPTEKWNAITDSATDARSNAIKLIQDFIACKNHNNEKFMQLLANNNILISPAQKTTYDLNILIDKNGKPITLETDVEVTNALKADIVLDNAGVNNITSKFKDIIKLLDIKTAKTGTGGGKSKRKTLEKYSLSELKAKALRRKIKVKGLKKSEIIAKLRRH